MKKSSLKIFIFPMLMFALFAFVSCDKERVNSESEAENFALASVDVIQRSAGVGKHGCFEFVFPLEISFPDSIVLVVDSYESLKTAIKDFKEGNPDATGRPTLVFPLEVITSDGAVVSITSKEDLKDLKSTCRMMNRGNRGGACFSLIYPISINFPDGGIVEYNNRASLKAGVRDWKQANPDADERPELVFPLEVELEDESTVTVHSKEELIALKEGCINS